MDKMNENSAEFHQIIQLARKEVEKLKGDLQDILEVKHE